MINIAQEIRRLRKQFDLSPSGLAEKASLSPAYISKLEKGEYKSLSLKTCKSLANGFDMSLRDFLESIDFIDKNNQRSSSQLVSHALRTQGYSNDEVVKIKEYAEFLRKTRSK